MTEDLAGTAWRPGGPSLFSALTARALGLDVTLVTNLPASYDRSALGGLTLVTAPATTAPRYENRYDEHGHRTQALLAAGKTIGSELLARIPGPRPDVLLVAPAYHEVRGWPECEARVRAVALQGPLRIAGDDRSVRPTARPWQAMRAFAQPGSFLFFSEEDCPRADSLARRAAEAGATVAVTRGRRGASLFRGPARHDVAAYPADERDPTGAGDCFATAFLVRFAETGSLDEALAYGLAAGALAVQGAGVAAVPGREAIDALVRRMAA